MLKQLDRSLLAVVVLAIAAGCSSTPTITKTESGGRDWKADFLRQRDEAESNVRMARSKLAANSEELAEAQNRYQRARNAVNLLLEGIQTSIRDGENPTASPFYASRSREAEESLLNFNNYVTRTAVPPEMQPKFLPLALPLVTSIGGFIWDKVAASCKQQEQERKAVYERIAADLNSVRFSDFTDIRR